jgi:preprotein translocase subunit SecE
MNIIDKAATFLKEVRLEMKKVNWLSRIQVTNYTLLVLGVILSMALYFGALDFAFSGLLNSFVLGR